MLFRREFRLKDTNESVCSSFQNGYGRKGTGGGKERVVMRG